MSRPEKISWPTVVIVCNGRASGVA